VSDGRTLASGGGRDGTVRLWDLDGASPRERTRVSGESAAVAPDGKVLVTSLGREVRLWDLGGAEPAGRTRLTGAAGLPLSVLFTPDGSRFAVGGVDAVRVWDMIGGRPRDRAVLEGHQGVGYDNPLALTADGLTLAAGEDQDRAVGLWDLRESPPRRRVASPRRSSRVAALALDPGGKTLVVGRRGIPIEVWDLTGDEPRERAALSGPLATSLAFAPDGRIFASANLGIVALCDAATGRELSRWQLPTSVTSVAFAPDGRHLFLGLTNGPIHVLRLAPASQ